MRKYIRYICAVIDTADQHVLFQLYPVGHDDWYDFEAVKVNMITIAAVLPNICIGF
jgi:hypothetical protein